MEQPQDGTSGDGRIGLEEAQDLALHWQKLQEEIAEIQRQIAAEIRQRAKGRRQIPRRLPTVPQVFERWEGSFYGIPEDWADELKPSPLKVRYIPGREEPFSAMRMVDFEYIGHMPENPKGLYKADEENAKYIWVKRGGRCRCLRMRILGLVHPHWSPCWKTKMVKLLRTSKEERKQEAKPAKPYRFTKSMRATLQKRRAAEEWWTDKWQARRKEWSEIVKTTTKTKKAKPEVTLAQLRAVRFLRKQILSLREEITR